MSVTIDHEQLEVEHLGLATVGQVLSHISRANRLVVNLLIDGSQPDLDRIGEIRASALLGRTLFIETADPRGMALDVLTEVSHQMDNARRLVDDAITCFRKEKASDAMGKLSGCFTVWHHAQDSVVKTAQLLRIDLSRVLVAGKPLDTVVGQFSAQLRLIKSSLEERDYVTLIDVLTYETIPTSDAWKQAIAALQATIRGEN